MNKLISLAFIIPFLLASCASDEQKALDYVKTEVLPEKAIQRYLMRYNAKNVNTAFWEDLREYLNSVCSPCDKHSYIINLPNGDYYQIGSSRHSLDYWSFDSRYGYYDSEKILQLIYNQVNENIKAAIENDSIEYYGSTDFSDSPEYEFASYDDNVVKDAVLYEAVNFRGFFTPVWDNKVKKLGIEDSRENRERYQYNWTAKSPKQQQDFVFSLAGHILSTAVCMVYSNEFKLVDTQGEKSGENSFKVTYLLEPKLKIVFDVTKVGKTFTCDNIIVDGSITWNINKDESDEDII